jgi:hypothetical protein
MAWANFRVADHLDTMARGGRWSFRRWCYSGKSRLMIPHQSVAHCPGRLKTPRAQRRDRSTWEEQQGGHSMWILNTSSASLLLAAASKSMSLDKVSH